MKKKKVMYAYEDLMKTYPQPAKTARYLEVIFSDALKLAKALLDAVGEIEILQEGGGIKQLGKALAPLEKHIGELRSQLQRAEEVLKGCSDVNCRLKTRRTGGMATNGGCHCVDRINAYFAPQTEGKI